MGLTSGTKLGPYEIQTPLGAGGMGEVYRARDTRLDRTVAIKILPDHLSTSADARQRFDREAHAISSLSHPNICHLYDIGQQDATSYLVMEFLEGETLGERLRKGPLPLERAIKTAIELCEGLEKAHRNGIIHRDLKPGNIMLTKSGTKLMDFGLAKAPVATAKGLSSSASRATMSQPLTTEGTIVGTIQYMSPEQLEGDEADARSDIFAFGAVLYEMITGTRAFEGKTTASTIAAILAAEPKPISAVQPTSPPALDQLIRTCLAKDPEDRLQTAHDLKLQLQWLAQSSSRGIPTVQSRAAVLGRLLWAVAGLLVIAIVGGGIAWWQSTHRLPATLYFGSPISLIANDLALSPDAKTVAAVAFSEQANKFVIWRYQIGGRDAVVIPGTEDAAHPFWSADGKEIGFFADGKLKKVDAFSGMSAQVLYDAPNGRGGAWNRDGVILFTPDAMKGLHRIASTGGTAVEITRLDASRSESSHRWPAFLPDQRHFLYLGANFSGEFDKNAIFVGSLDSNDKHFVVSASSNATYAEPGYLLYIRNNALVAQRFDLRTFDVSGEAHVISDQVQYTPTTDLAVFSVAGEHTLVLQTGKGIGTSQLLWFNRSGKQLGLAGPPGLFGNLALSPDGHRVLFDQMETDRRHFDIWVRDLASDATTRLTFGPGLNQFPVWSPDGKQVAYSGIRKGAWSVYIKNADGSGPERPVTNSVSYHIQAPWDWGRAGDVLIWRNGELWSLPLPSTEPRPILRQNWIIRNAQFSPDGKWFAYASNEAGNWDVYVSPFPRADNKWQVSHGGGSEPRWRRDGKELFFLSSDGKMMAAPVKTDPVFQAGPAVALFQTHPRQPISALDRVSYDVTADGQKFLVDTKVDEPNAAPMSVILNWSSELEK